MRRWWPGSHIELAQTANLSRPCVSFPAATPSYACPAGELWAQSTAAREAIALFCPPHGRYIHHPTALQATQPRPDPFQTIGPAPATRKRHDFGRA